MLRRLVSRMRKWFSTAVSAVCFLCSAGAVMAAVVHIAVHTSCSLTVEFKSHLGNNKRHRCVSCHLALGFKTEKCKCLNMVVLQAQASITHFGCPIKCLSFIVMLSICFTWLTHEC